MRTSGLGWLLALAVFGYLLAFPPVLGHSDESILLYGARRILEGQRLYKDFFDFITPVSFYVFAAVFWVSGASLQAAHIVMAAINACSCLFLFELARRVASRVEAGVAVLLFATTCLPVWPYASAHWLSTALCLATAAVLLAVERRRAAVVGVLSGLTFCVHQHRGVALGAWIVLSTAIMAFLQPDEGRWPRWRRDLWRIGGAWLGVTVIVLAYAVWQASVSSVLHAIVTFVFRNYASSSITSGISWAGVCFLCGSFVPYTWHRMLRDLPVVLVVEGLAIAWTWWRQRDDALVLRLCVLSLAVMMCIAILYYPDFIHIAFLAPFTFIVGARLAYATQSMGIWRRHVVLAALPVLAVAAVSIAAVYKGWTNLDYARAQAPERFASAMGTLAGTGEDRQLLQAVREVLNRHDTLRHTLFSYPADPWLYLAAPADNPTPFTLLYPDYSDPDQFKVALDALQRSPPECLVVNVALLRNDDPVLRVRAEHYRREASVGPYEIYARNP